MGAMDFQLGCIDEVSYNTPLTVTRFFEYNGDPLPVVGKAGRTEGNPLRVGTRARRTARTIPYFDHAEGTVEFDVMNKGFGFWLKHMLPSVATTGAGPYVHTATEGTNSSALMGKSFTAQFNAPFHPTGTNQAITYSGGKIPKWSLTNSTEGMLTLALDMWFASMTTGTALATASYPSNMTNFSWAGGAVTVGGSAFKVTNIELEVDQGYNLERTAIQGSTVKQEPTPGVLSGTFGIEADFDSLTQWNRVHSTTVAGMSAAIVGTWTNSTDIIQVTVPFGRFDELEPSGDPGGLGQNLGGVIEGDGTSSPVTIAYTTTDATP